MRRPDFRPRALLRAVRHRGAGHHGRPRATTWPTTRPSATTPRSRTRVLPTFRPDRYLEPGRPDWRGAGRRARRRGRHRHRRLRGLHRRAGGPAPLLHRARRRLRRPQPRRRRHRPARPGRGRADLRGGPRGHGDARSEATALRRHLLLEMARMSVEDGLVMTLHPGVHRNHHTPTLDRFGADVGRDIPIADGVHPRPAAAAGALRHGHRLPPRAVHPRRDRVLPGDRARSPASTRASTRARRGGSSTPRRRSAATAAPSPRPPGSAAPRASSTTPARSAPSRPATTCRAGSTAATSPSWSPAPPRRGRGAGDGARPGRRQPEGGVQAVTETPTRHPAPAGPRRATAAPPPRSGSPTSGPATSSAPTRPGTPSTPRTPPTGASPPSPAAAAPSPASLAAQDGLYTLLVRAADGDRPEVVSAVVRGLGRARRLAALLRPTRSWRW